VICQFHWGCTWHKIIWYWTCMIRWKRNELYARWGGEGADKVTSVGSIRIHMDRDLNKWTVVSFKKCVCLTPILCSFFCLLYNIQSVLAMSSNGSCLMWEKFESWLSEDFVVSYALSFVFIASMPFLILYIFCSRYSTIKQIKDLDMNV
jgi:hypothetical protein